MPPPLSPDPSPPTIEDVARDAGVHPSTVSRVLSRPGRINERTAARVRASATRLGYEPNRAARRLAGGPTGTIGVLVPDLGNPFFASIARTVQHRVALRGARTYVVDSGPGSAGEAELIESLARDVDGLVLCAPTAASRAIRESAGTTPTVLVNRRMDGLPSVVADQTEAVTAAADHLRRLGHDRISYLRGPSSKWVSGIRDRTATRLGLAMIGPCSPDFDGGAATADLILDRGDTAVITHNDLVALGLVDGLLQASRDVPSDVSVVGCDDIDAAAITRPRLTTVAMPLDGLGSAAADLLESLLGRGESPSSELTLPVTLVVRETTGARRGEHQRVRANLWP